MADEWDVSKPIDHTLIRDFPGEDRKITAKVKTVLEKEHEDLGDGNTGGEHSSGSSVCYEGTDTPSNRPDGVTALADNAVDRGRLRINDNNDPPTLERWDGASWESLGTLITGTAPIQHLHNTTEEDADGGRESQVRAKGEQSGGEVTTLGYLEFSHDGALDDQKGQAKIVLNDGDDDDVPSVTPFAANADGTCTLGDSSQMTTDAAPTDDVDLANKKYVDDQIAAIDFTSLFGSWIDEDSDVQPLVEDHTYKVTSDGFIAAWCKDSGGDWYFYTSSSKANVDAESENALKISDIGTASCYPGFSCPVKKNEYWRISASGGAGNRGIWFIPIGTGECQDQD